MKNKSAAYIAGFLDRLLMHKSAQTIGDIKLDPNRAMGMSGTVLNRFGSIQPAMKQFVPGFGNFGKETLRHMAPRNWADVRKYMQGAGYFRDPARLARLRGLIQYGRKPMQLAPAIARVGRGIGKITPWVSAGIHTYDLYNALKSPQAYNQITQNIINNSRNQNVGQRLLSSYLYPVHNILAAGRELNEGGREFIPAMSRMGFRNTMNYLMGKSTQA